MPGNGLVIGAVPGVEIDPAPSIIPIRPFSLCGRRISSRTGVPPQGWRLSGLLFLWGHSNEECGVDRRADVVERPSNTDRVLSNIQRVEKQVDSGVDRRRRRPGGRNDTEKGQ